MFMEAYRKMLYSFVPDKLEKQIKEKGTLVDGIKYVLLSSVSVIAVMVLYTILLSLLAFIPLLTQQSSTDTVLWTVVSLLIGLVILLLAVPLVLIVLSFIWSALTFVICKLLGGKATFANHYYHLSLIGGALTIFSALSVLIPCLGRFIVIALNLYYLYPSFIVYRGIHKLSNPRAALAALLPLVFAILLIAATIILGILSFIAALLGQSSSGLLI